MNTPASVNEYSSTVLDESPRQCYLSSPNTSLAMTNLAMSRLNDEMSCIEDTAEGSFGVVKRAILDVNQQTYAVKESKKAITGEGDLQQRLQEVYALSACRDVNIIHYLDGWVENRSVYLMMEFLPEATVAKLARPVPESFICALLHQLACALHCLHRHNVVHRDVKPENILYCCVDKEMEYVFKLCDFGLARPVLTSCASTSGELFRGINDNDGDRNYLCPESMECAEFDRTGDAADIYALGASCVELMGGDPFLVRDGLYTGSFSTYSAELQELVRRMTASESSIRPNAFAVASATLPTEMRAHTELIQRQELVDVLQNDIDTLQDMLKDAGGGVQE